MEEMITIRVYDAVNNIYYDKEVPYEYDIKKGKADKFAELETYIAGLKEQGVKYEMDDDEEIWFKCDDEAMNNIIQTSMMIDVLLPVTWFTRNGEQGYIILETKEEWQKFMGTLANKMAEIKNKYYTYKYAIEQAKTEEELKNITFE